MKLSHILVAVLSLSNSAAWALESIGVVKESRGEALIHRKEAPDTKVTNGLSVVEGDQVETKAGGAVRLLMNDNSSFSLNENSKLDLKEYATKEPLSKATLMLEGDLHSDVQNKNKNEKLNFRIITPGGVLGIRGTQFLTEAHDKKMRVTTFEGVVEVGDTLEGRKINHPVVVEKGFQFEGSEGKYEGKAAWLLSPDQLKPLKSKVPFSPPTFEASNKDTKASTAKETAVKASDAKDPNAKSGDEKDQTKGDPKDPKKKHVK